MSLLSRYVSDLTGSLDIERTASAEIEAFKPDEQSDLDKMMRWPNWFTRGVERTLYVVALTTESELAAKMIAREKNGWALVDGLRRAQQESHRGEVSKMNPDRMEFERETSGCPLPEAWRKFTVGERVTLSGVVFEVAQIETKRLHLRPVEMAEAGPTAEIQAVSDVPQGPLDELRQKVLDQMGKRLPQEASSDE